MLEKALWQIHQTLALSYISDREFSTRPCPRCGNPTPIYRLAVEDVQRNGWRCFAPAMLVHWCGHGIEVIPIPDADGVCDLVPVVGEAW